MEVLGAALRVITTSSVEAAQGALLIVQRKVYAPVPPAGVKVAVGEVVLLNWAREVEGPLTTDHAPVPTPGALAARVNPPLQLFWSGPALEVVGAPVTVITTSSVELVQPALLIVQRRV